MSITAVKSSGSWFRQASSHTSQQRDTRYHNPALVQAIEKSLKGYVILNGATPAMDHRLDKYLIPLMTRKLLRYVDHYRQLSTLFNLENKAVVRRLLDLIPGGLGQNRTDVPNTEYPWTDTEHHAPIDASEFADKKTLMQWVNVAKRVVSTLSKLWSSVHLIEAVR